MEVLLYFPLGRPGLLTDCARPTRESATARCASKGNQAAPPSERAVPGGAGAKGICHTGSALWE